jgi:hypothetical protein
VEKAIGFEESRLAGEPIYLINSFLDQNDLGICFIGTAPGARFSPP